MSKAKKLIRDFKRDFARSMEKGDSKEVYQICIQLFPLLIPESEHRIKDRMAPLGHSYKPRL